MLDKIAKILKVNKLDYNFECSYFWAVTARLLAVTTLALALIWGIKLLTEVEPNTLLWVTAYLAGAIVFSLIASVVAFVCFIALKQIPMILEMLSILVCASLVGLQQAMLTKFCTPINKN